MLFFRETWKVRLVQSTWPLMMMRGVTHNLYLGRYGMWIHEKGQVVKLEVAHVGRKEQRSSLPSQP